MKVEFKFSVTQGGVHIYFDEKIPNVISYSLIFYFKWDPILTLNQSGNPQFDFSFSFFFYFFG